MDHPTAIKTILIVVLFVISFGSAVFPFILRRKATSSNTNPGRRRLYMLTFSFLSCYGGGIFVGTCLMDLLPDGREKLTKGIVDMGIEVAKDYPLTEFMVCVGFLLILVSEQTGVWYKERKAKYLKIVEDQKLSQLEAINGLTADKPDLLEVVVSKEVVTGLEDMLPAIDETDSTEFRAKPENQAKHVKIDDYEIIDETQHKSSDHESANNSTTAAGNQHTHPHVYHIAKRLVGDIHDHHDSHLVESPVSRDHHFHFNSPEGQLDGLVTKPFQTETTPYGSRRGSNAWQTPVASRRGSNAWQTPVGSRKSSRRRTTTPGVSRKSSKKWVPTPGVSRKGSSKRSSPAVSRRESNLQGGPPEGVEKAEKGIISLPIGNGHVTYPDFHSLPSPLNVLSLTEHEDDGTFSVSDSENEPVHEAGEEMIHAHFDPDEHSALRALLLVTALSLHSLFEGMALGLQSDMANIVTIFIALVIHKSIVSFSLGLRLVQSPLRNIVIVCCDLIFCTMALIGGVVGIVVTEALNAGLGELINGMLTGIACGTFLYITFFEILPHELNPPSFRMAKLLVLVFGFITTAILMFYA